MLFNSILFCFVFLPLAFLGFLILSKAKGKKAKLWWLVIISFGFYAWWSPYNLLLLLCSVAINFRLGQHLQKGESKTLLVIGVALNLANIAFFKYSVFLASIFTLQEKWESLVSISLPLAISFYTFQQITYLVDCYKGKVKNTCLRDYVLYVTFFPQLIAGPIVHNHQILPQFKDLDRPYDFRYGAFGLILFTIGLTKKILLADGMAEIATPLYDAVGKDVILTVTQSWEAAVGYTLQLYYDFSGYSDMAIGLGAIFNIKLPKNFNSPYKAVSISDFWRRWHITLSNFLRDYLYIPLGGNRNGLSRQYGNLLITMLLGGLWHGAAWSFVIWGGWHGFLLIINHGWSSIRSDKNSFKILSMLIKFVRRPLTLLAVILGWVLFRAENFSVASSVISSMFGLQEPSSQPFSYYDDFQIYGVASLKYTLIILGVIIALFLPNSMAYAEKTKKLGSVTLSLLVGACISIMAVILLINLGRSSASEFIYFNF